jgi:GSH-dependent disulfide-bond oxidoreductase
MPHARKIKRLMVLQSSANFRFANLKDVMTKKTEYEPPKVWIWDKGNGGQFASTNRPIAGPTHDKALPQGKHPLQLYSLGTPNGQKVTIMLEELLAEGVRGAEYDAHLIRIGEGDQFSSGFVDVNPNSKIPALLDCSFDTPVRVFESGAILLYLAEKFDRFLPRETAARTETLNWLFWLQGSAPYLGGGFGHFYLYAPDKIEYAINRFAMEAKRQLDVLDRQLAERRFIAGDTYTIADMAIWPWYGGIVRNANYNAAEFLDTASYKNLSRWTQEIWERPAVQRGRIVNRSFGPLAEQLHERHDASDFETNTEDKRQAKV